MSFPRPFIAKETWKLKHKCDAMGHSRTYNEIYSRLWNCFVIIWIVNKDINRSTFFLMNRVGPR